MSIKKLYRSVYKRLFLNIPDFTPIKEVVPEKCLDVESAWKGLDLIIPDIIDQFNLSTESCLEFGTEFGYSAVVFSNYFKKVKGVDLFTGDIHTAHKGDHYESTKKNLATYTNIELIKADYRDWIKNDNNHYDLIHVDIVHDYENTYDCGLWSVAHSKCTIFHDTESYFEVRKAVVDIAKKTGKKVYNYRKHYGLGIIV